MNLISKTLLCALIVLTGASCLVRSESSPHGVSRTVSAEVDLSGKSEATLSETFQQGEAVTVRVEVTQEPDANRACGVPSVYDSYGNRMAELTPQSGASATGARYVYSFVPAVTGMYEVRLDNQECNVALVDATAQVEWESQATE